jgi:hypothetical protein
MKQLLRALALTLTLSTAVPAPVFAAARAPRHADSSEYKMFGYAVMAIMAIGGLWWKFWGKKMVKDSVKPTQCSYCTEHFDAEDLITLHPHTSEYVEYTSPDIKQDHRPDYKAMDVIVQKSRLKKVPKQKHVVCPSCAITIFKSAFRVTINPATGMSENAGTCYFHHAPNGHYGHGLCVNCDGRGACLYCPVEFEEGLQGPNKCKLLLDINWVDRNNPDMKKTIKKLCANGTYDDDANRLIRLWNTMCQDYPKMIAELKGSRHPERYIGSMEIGNKWCDKWDKI